MRKELVFAFFCILLAILAFSPLLLIELGNHTGTVLARVSSMFSAWQEILVALGTLFLITGFSTLSVYLSNSTNEKTNLAQRKTEAQKLLASFRKEWIEDLRADCATLASIIAEVVRSETPDRLYSDEKIRREVSYHISQIKLKVNPADPLYGKLTECMYGMIDNPEQYRPIDFNEIVQRILKKEWNRLIQDLEGSIK